MLNKDFTWGVATSAYQIEGAAYEDGKGLSVWDTYCKRAGKIFDGNTGDVACDHYHRYKEDIQLMKKLGVTAYRFSVAWTRILPDGIGRVNEAGVDFYNRLIDELLEAGITPYMTLFHWDYPQELYYRGAWLNPDSPKWFEEYATVIASRFGDRVKHFFTLNEPQCFIGGFANGAYNAPGVDFPIDDAIRMSHHVLMAHGLAVKALRENCPGKVMIGYAPTHGFAYPADENNPADVEASYKRSFEVSKDAGNFIWNASWWTDPVILGTYPEDGLEYYGKYLPEGWQDDMKIIRQPLDFLGQNQYNGFAVKADENGEGVYFDRGEGYTVAGNGWPVVPKSMKWCLIHLWRRYHTPLYITENGISLPDCVSHDGHVHDAARINYINDYLANLVEAAEAGVDVRGYFAWSLLDNFEWGSGYKYRFGLYYVDYKTQERIAKDSALWYRTVIDSNGESLIR